MWSICVNKVYEENICYLQLLGLKAIVSLQYLFMETIFRILRYLFVFNRENNFGKLCYTYHKTELGQKSINMRVTNVILAHRWRTSKLSSWPRNFVIRFLSIRDVCSIRYKNIHKVGGVNALFTSGANGVSLVKEKLRQMQSKNDTE